nr:reverse transcriptase domain-containing protein [Tanacetum cinerariifolium]
MPRECLAIIESKSKVLYSRNKPVVAKVSTNTSTFGISPDVVELKDMVKAVLFDKKSQSPAPVKAIKESCVTCSVTHFYRNCPATDGNVYRDNIQEFVSQAFPVNYNQGNTSYRPPMMSNQFRPPGFPPVPNNQNVQRNNQNRFIPNQNRGNNFNQGPVYQPLVFQPPAYQAPAYQAPAPQTQGQNMQNQLTNLTDLITNFVNSNSASTSRSRTLPSNTITNPKSDLKAITTQSGVSYDGPQIPPLLSFLPKVVEDEPEAKKDTVNPTNNESTEGVQPQPNPKTLIPYPSKRNDERNREKANNQIKKFYQIFKDMSFEIIFADALILMPKFALTLRALIGNKEKLSEMARTPLNEHCSAVLLKKLPKKLEDPGKFLKPCDFPGMVECLALADLGASINLMPFSIWKRLSLPDLTPTCMTLDLADCLISRPVGVAEDVYVKVGSFYFLTDFVVVDFDVDPRVPLILGRSFLKTKRALIDVFEAELTLQVGKEAITFNLDQTSRYSTNYSDMTAKRINVIDMACEEYSQEISDFLLEEVDAFLAIEDDPTSLEFYQPYIDLKEDILLLEAFLNDDPSPPPNQGNYLPEVRKELKICEAKSDKSSVDEPPEVKLKDLPPYLEYALLEGDEKLPVIIAKDLSVEEKTALTTVLKSHKRAIAWKFSDIKGIDPEFCTHKILMEEDFEPAGGFTVVENDDNELTPTRLVMGWCVCIDYHKLNEATRKDHFPLPFMDQMLERLAGNQYYCFLDGFSGYFQIPINQKDQEKTIFTCPYGTFAYRRMPFGLCNAPGTFQRCMMAIFNDIIEKTMEVFMDDFSVFGNSFQSCLSYLERMLREKIKKMNVINIKAMQTQINNVKNKLRNEMKNSIQALMSNQTNELKNMMASFFQMNTASTLGSGPLHSNTIANPKGELKSITARSGIVLDVPSVPIPPPFINPDEDEHEEETLTDQDLAEDPLHPNIPYPSRMHKKKQQEKDEVQIHKFWQMFKQLHINITLADTLILILKYQKMLKALLSNKEKLLELPNTPLNENCSAVILKKLPEKLRDTGKFLISCGFIESDTKYVYDDPFDSKGEKIKESKLLIDELYLLRSSDFLPSLEYDSFFFEDFSEDDALPSTNNEDKVLNPGILILENLFEVNTRVALDKNVKKISISHASLILKDFDPPLFDYELPFHKEVPRTETVLLFPSENEEKVFKLGILTSKGVHSSLLLEISHQGHNVFKIIIILESPMEIFPCFCGEDIRILDVPYLYFYPP